MKYLDVPSSGSIADRTHSHNRAGQYTRNRRSPVQPLGTGRRGFIRAAFGSASQGWGGETELERAAWAAAADAHPIVDSLGQSIKLTGHQLYVAINTQRLNVGLAISGTVPLDFTVAAVTDVVLTADAAPSTLAVEWAGLAASDFLLTAFSPPLPPGRSFTSRFWQAGFSAGTDSPADVVALYTAEFGAMTAGTRIFARLTPVNQYGVTGTALVKSVVVVA